ncbi:MAG: GNAT family N-acetyltransferase [Caldilineaceae bacterium]|nr:GNAT family N-acetyltransferase [Caldilineaceae bacterium]
MSTYSIIPLTSADEPFLAEMMYQAIFVPAGTEAPPRSVVEAPALHKYFADFGTQSGDIGYKAINPQTGNLVGAAWLRLLSGDKKGYGYVDDQTPELSIATAPAHRGQGIGTQLLDQLFTAAAEHYSAISLSVWPENPAYRLYQRLGFVVVKQDEGDPAVTMIKYF